MRRTPKPQNYSFDRLLRNFRNKGKRDGKLEKLREKQYYEKPAQKKQRVKNAAKRREAKQNIAKQSKTLHSKAKHCIA